jgi:preprotein translocase subunit SecD
VAPPAGTLRVGRYFLALLLILAVLYTIVFWPGTRHTPKLGIDLVGGTEVVFTAKTPNGSKPSKSAMSQAKEIMTNRVNGTGVTQSTVAVQNGNQLVVDIPKSSHTDIASLGKAAVLSMRGLLMPPQPVTCSGTAPSNGPAPATGASGTPSPTTSATTGAKASTPTSSAAPKDAAAHPLLAPTPTTTPKKTPSPTGTAKPTSSATPSPTGSSTTPPKCVADPLAGLSFTIPNAEKCDSTAPKQCVAYSTLTSAQQTQLQAAVARMECNAATSQSDTAQTYVACEDVGNGTNFALLLGPAIVQGKQISSASALAPNSSQGQVYWTVDLKLKDSGQVAWGKWTSAHNLGGANAQVPDPTTCAVAATPCSVYVAFVLDGGVISAPGTEEPITGADTQISGNFTPSAAKKLANQLKYGALPLSFTAQDAVSVSATLGASQLRAGLLAGGIGLILVVVYSLLYYRALGFVTIASLVVSGALVYGSLVMLGTQIGFTLSLAGIAGFIVAIGITADSFVVFFERMKDEVHEGRSARVAIPRAWVRARRTILSADTVSFLAAAILYYFAAGDVKGFAFTLGLSTILDLIVVFLFTHPLVSLLSRMRTFGSARFTGLDAIRGGADAVAVAAPPPPRRRPGSRRPSRPVEEAQSAVGVLDEPVAEPADASADEPVTEPADVRKEMPAPPEEPVAEHATEAVDEPAERRRTTPAAGSAAERAAARRARMRAQKDDER